MEEAHSKFHILSHGFFACILYHFAPSFVNTNSSIKRKRTAYPLSALRRAENGLYAAVAKRLSSGNASLPDCFLGSASRFFWGERWAAAHTCLRDFSPGNSYRNARRFLRFPISITLNPALRARDSNPLRLPSSLRGGLNLLTSFPYPFHIVPAFVRYVP